MGRAGPLGQPRRVQRRNTFVLKTSSSHPDAQHKCDRKIASVLGASKGFRPLAASGDAAAQRPYLGSRSFSSN